MKTLYVLSAMVLFVISLYLFNATNEYFEVPVTTGWIFNDTGNCDLQTVSA